MKTISYLIILNFVITYAYSCFGASRFETRQLPLSTWQAKYFPNLNSKFFFIANTELQLVMHERNSEKKIRCGTFSDVLFAIALKIQYGKKLPTLSKNDIYLLTHYLKKQKLIDITLNHCGISAPKLSDISLYRDGNLLSLHEISIIFNKFYEFLLIQSDFLEKYNNNLNVFIFYSIKYGYGTVLYYTNINNTKFIVCLSGCKKKLQIYQDFEKVCKWLDKFCIKAIPPQYKLHTKIPIFYGEQKYLDVWLNEPREVIGIANKSERILRSIRYLMRLSAPVRNDNKIGWIYIKSTIFSNPIVTPIISNKNINKSNILLNFCDSICYILYNRPCKIFR